MSLQVSLVMIVYNESRRLAKCLDSVLQLAAEIIIVDTGSTDNTVELACKYTDKVYSCAWRDDFSRIRNFALGLAGGDWILTLDADEELEFRQDELDLEALLKEQPEVEAYMLPLLNPLSDKEAEYNRFYVLRFFKNNGKFRYFGTIHEQLNLPPEHKVGIIEALTIRHAALSARDRRQKRSRNLPLLQRALRLDPENPFLQYYLGAEWLMLGNYSQALPLLEFAQKNLPSTQLQFRSAALRYLILCLRELGRWEEALCLCLHTAPEHPLFSDIFYFGGLLLTERQEYEAAARWFEQALQSGPPPPPYSHLNGTAGYLAAYHLGFCREMLGELEPAIQAYTQALTLNPAHAYPLYNVLIILLARSGPEGIYQHLETHGLSSARDVCRLAAEILAEYGYPEWAYRLIVQTQSAAWRETAGIFPAGKYALLAGWVQTALEIWGESGDTEWQVIALLLSQSAQARRQAIKLWQNPEKRAEGYLLLKLSRWLDTAESGENLGEFLHARSIREIQLSEISFKWLKELNKVSFSEPEERADVPRLLRNLLRLRQALTTIVLEAPGVALRLKSYYQEKAALLQTLLNYRFLKQ